MSVFLMGCFDEDDEKFKSVTKVHGHDDETLTALQVRRPLDIESSVIVLQVLILISNCSLWI